MIRRFIFATIVLLSLQVQAVVVVNTAGQLHDKVTNLGITELTVKGTMDARDFYFIVENLTKLNTVDLSQVQVVACHTDEPRYWTQDFADAMLPAGAFADMDLTGVNLPAALTAIGKGAFSGCDKLTSISFPTTLVSIGDYAFAGCSAISTITLPASVTTVGHGAFMRCSSLTSLTVAPSSRLCRLEETALMDCPALTMVNLGANVQSVGDRALAGTGVKKLNLTASSNLSEMGDWVMVNTPLQEVQLPSSLTNLGDGAFLYDKALASVKLGGHVSQLNDYLLAGTALAGNMDFTGVNSLGDYVLYNVSTLSVVELPATVTWIGSYAMAGMTGMRSMVSNAESVPALGENVWAGVNQPAIPLTVPAASVSSYKAADQWKLFKFGNSWLRGDVNGDGEVNIADINALINIILGNIADAETMLRADVNEDGEVNVGDINALVDIILGPSHLASPEVDTGDLLRLADVSMRPGDERTLTLELDNAGAYSALQCDITLPQGLTLVGVSASQGNEKAVRDMDEFTTRTLTYSMNRREFDSEDHAAVLSITVRADAALACESDIVLSQVVLADNDNVAWHAADYVARVSNTTGIDDLTAVADRVWVEGRILCVETRNGGTARITAINGTSHTFAAEQGVNRHELEPGFYVVTINNKSYKIAIK